MRFTIKEITDNKQQICRSILDALPDWFGLIEAKETYTREVGNLLMLGCFNDQGTCIGFLTLKNSTPDAIEIHVMGILPNYHRQGAGSYLVLAAEERVKSANKELLFVKTLSSDPPDPHYAKTRQFYTKVGFIELVVLPMVWDEENPCLIMVKKI